MKKLVDHEGKTGGLYEKRAPMDEEARRKRSETMKAHNRKTGLGTIMGNRLAKMKRMKPEDK